MLAGTPEQLHVAVFNEPNPIGVTLSHGKGNNFHHHEAEQYLAVRSFVNDDWPAPKSPPPATFKETKPPTPTMLEF